MENRIGPSIKIIQDERQNFEEAREKANQIASNGGLKTFAKPVSVGGEEYYVVNDGATIMVVPTKQIS